MTRAAALCLLVALTSLGCATAEDADAWSDCGGKCDDDSHSVPAINAPGLLVNHLPVLGELERSGHGLGDKLGGDSTSTKALHGSSPTYRDVADVLTADLTELGRGDSLAGVGINYAHRLFDSRWLRSSAVRFRLVAITNRLDLVHATPGGCGEVRFVYRLMYEQPQGTSRLPMSLMVVHVQPMVAGGCAAVARAWQSGGGAMSAAALARGPLAMLAPPSRIEINLQSVRWPATVRADMGGHAEYLLRVFDFGGPASRALAGPLANTISGDLSPTQLTELRRWIIENVAAIDAGTAIMPDRFLARRDVSVSPRGLARAGNRPALTAFPNPEQEFAGVDFSRTKLIKSAAGLVRRLDTMSCQGCHQARGLAGFHVLGQDDPGLARANAIEVGTSPHLNEELAWRRQVLQATAGTGGPAGPRPFAERDASVPGRYGAHCGLGDPSFEAWTCADGFTCADLNGDEVGVCVVETGAGAGDACEASDVTFDPNPRADRVVEMEVLACSVPGGGRAKCSRSSNSPGTLLGGFPNGACTGSCRTMGATAGDAICGAEPPSGFNACLAAGKSFDVCMANAVPQFRRRCDAATPCGDDYVCAGVAGAPRGVGACMPPYFIFQARVDGHRVDS
ncbi:MAG: hypothetical protein KA190_19855 [Kofleriaceae bacterium]|nr:hypothetical protein [Kofleriaceae bacterium]